MSVFKYFFICLKTKTKHPYQREKVEETWGSLVISSLKRTEFVK